MMRVVHDVQDEMQCGAARNGELISVSLCNAEEQIHIEGNPKHIVAALKEALGAIEAVLASREQEDGEREVCSAEDSAAFDQARKAAKEPRS
jgi:hypothetical protein